MSRHRSLLTIGLGLSLALAGCDDGPPEGCDRWVSPGGDDRTTVQTMFEEAEDDEVLCLTPGTYRFDDGVSIAEKTGITIRGTGGRREDVVLDFSTMGTGNSGLNASSMTGFVLENLQVLDAAANGVFITRSTDVTIRNVSAGWRESVPESERGRYALYPVQSTRVIVEDSEAFGSVDAGIYVGQTERCIVRNSLAHRNVAGIEIENSTDCEVHGNVARENTAGILVFELPGLERRGSRTLVHDNEIIENNVPNFDPDPSSIVSKVPAGIGVMILAANDVEVRDNLIRGNSSLGVAVVSYEVPLALDVPAPMDEGFDAYPDRIWVHDNIYEDNGGMPDGVLNLITNLQEPPGETLEDILWDGALGEGQDMPSDALCIDESGTYRMASIADLFATQSTDRGPVTCEGMAIDPLF